MDKFFSVSTAVVSTIALIVLICVPWLVILAAPVFLLLSAPVAFISFLLHRRYSARLRSRLQVLIVDDEPMTISPLLVALNNPDLEVNLVTSSQQMLSQLREKSFDLMFLDRYMPDMNGDQALSVGDLDPELRKEKVPVIFFTSSAEGLAVQQYDKFRVRDIWHKGISLVELRDRLQNVMTEIAV